MRNPFLFRPVEPREEFRLGDQPPGESVPPQQNEGGAQLPAEFDRAVETFSKAVHLEASGDVKSREFSVSLREGERRVMVYFIDGLINKDQMNDFILRPLMQLTQLSEVDDVQQLIRSLMPQCEISLSRTVDKLSYDLNYGSAIIILEGMEDAVAVDIKGWEARGIEMPQSERVTFGPNDSFNEQLRTNTALVRRLVRNKNFVDEEVAVGVVSQTPCAILYVKNIVNDALVAEVKRRIESIKTDYIFSTAELEQYIEDDTFLPLPQLLSTERPDRVARSMIEGKVAVLVDGAPYALVLPTTFSDLNASPEDAFLRFPYQMFLHVIRLLAFGLSLLLPALYVAIINYHNEILPTDLLMSVVAAREKVPFSTIVEIIIMEVSLEIIREAGNRVPSPVGSTLSIVGGLILGQAAVSASIVSPILIIVVSLGAIGSFATPNYYVGISVRILKFIYIALAFSSGLLGIAVGLFVHIVLWSCTFSIGVPMLVPHVPVTRKGTEPSFFATPVWMHEFRPDYLNTKRKRLQPPVTRRWKQ